MLNLIKKITLVLTLTILLMGIAQPVFAQNKVFTLEELSQFDGKDGRKAYYAYEGVVYDVSDSPLWKLGEHFGRKAGQDLTGQLEGAPHGDDIVKKMPVVGTLAAVTATAKPEATVQPAVASATQTTAKAPWYAQRIRIAGLSLLAWSGILLAVAFILNFATCFALPWNHLPLPWSGNRPGPDGMDVTKIHKPWATIHRPFAWATVIFGIIHGVLGIMQLFGFYL